MNTTTIGWIGLGNMGIPMSQRLITAGYPVAVYNRNKEKVTALLSDQSRLSPPDSKHPSDLGARPTSSAATPAELISQAAVIFTMVSDDQAIRDIFQGENGLLKAATTGKLIINMSTVSPGISKEMAAACQKQGNQYLDAPVSGSVKQAETGQLVVMVGGDNAAFDRATSILQHLGRLVLRVGDAGAGNTAKLAINLLLGFHAQGLAEATLFARTHGVRTEDFLNIFNNSALGNVFGKIKGDAILQDNYKAAFALKLIAKDLRLAKAEGWNTPLAETTWQSYQQAEPGFGDQDIIAILQWLTK
jgi:3-hydroxyisobutyrate dehydrogenase